MPWFKNTLHVNSVCDATITQLVGDDSIDPWSTYHPDFPFLFWKPPRDNEADIKSSIIHQCKMLCENLRKNNTLKALTIHQKLIAKELLINIFQSLCQNTSLEKLDLSDNRMISLLKFNDQEKLDQNVKQMLIQNDTLKVLRMNKSNFFEGDAPFAKGLCGNKLISKDSRSSSSEIGLNHKGAVRIMQTLEQNTCLQELNLSRNLQKTAPEYGLRFDFNYDLEPSFALYFFHPLHTNATLQVLNISAIRIKKEGAKALAEMLSHNRTLNELHIEGCLIDGDRVTLVNLFFGVESCDDEECTEIVYRALLKHPSVKLKVNFWEFK